MAQQGRKRAKPGRTETSDQGQHAVNLALQGGGSHGAFTWGVLDRLLEEERITFEGISATSAGAMNAVVLAQGLSTGGREGAKAALADYWKKVSLLGLFSSPPPGPMDELLKSYGRATPAQVFFELATRVVSPYQFNPLNINPLRDLLQNLVDFEGLCAGCPVKIFLTATNVRSGKIRVFQPDELSVDAVLASACLPFLFQAVEIEGEDYWDGGYMGNPAIYPVIYHCDSRDVIVVHINPIERQETPTDAGAIFDRINEISFNSSLMREMRTIAFVTDLLDKGQLQFRNMKRLFIHAIESDDFLSNLSAASKMDPDWKFICRLRDKGRIAADAWLADHVHLLGKESSIDIKEKYL